MDIRGIEVTNQLRSAIRAKLLELGVRYDEELPDYILVMVVNKKTRQQMHEDLHLFLEDSTTPFVEWLHDQVLKKLQKVTVAKKKSSREFVPTIVVKQEEERKKRKNTAVTSLEETSSSQQSVGKILSTTKQEKTTEKSVLSPITGDKSPQNVETSVEENLSTPIVQTEITEIQKINETTRDTMTPEKTIADSKIIDNRSKTTKRSLEATSEVPEKPEKRPKPLETSRIQKSEEEKTRENEEKEKEKEEQEEEEEEEEKEEDEEEEEEEEEDEKTEKRLKSCINKPKITSAVSVKTRLGTISPRKKFEIHRNRSIVTGRPRQQNQRNLDVSMNRGNFSRSKSHDERDNNYPRSRCNFDSSARNRQPVNIIDSRNRQFFDDKRSGKMTVNDKSTRNSEKTTLNVKDRLGTTKNVFFTKKTIDETMRNDKNTIKNRLGPVKTRSRRIIDRDDDFLTIGEQARSNDEATIDDEDDDQSVFDVGPVKSRIIAVGRTDFGEKRTARGFDKSISNNDKTKINEKGQEEEEEEIEAGKTIASKVIVTPRPLKPLQPVQKRATQSLLLRAVAEANQSVVKQKNPEPVLTDNKPRLKRLRPLGAREIGKNLSVHLNATKRLVMEKIQVQLSTAETEEDNEKNKQYAPQPVNEEHMGVVMSLFQRSDDNQKFLVTLNGYNNNVIKEKSLSEEEEEEQEQEEEHFEMEVTEDDEIVVGNVTNDTSDRKISSPTSSPIIENDESEVMEKIIIIDENNENHNIENVETIEEVPERKRRKLSPIVYTRSRSRSPDELTTTILPISLATREISDKRPITDVSQSIAIDKSRDKCRYWPNCTLGTKCAFYHPGVPCSAFPACKYGEKCAYKHPKCKFGLACTKLGCAFSHPKQQCKYHPFCTKPNCPYSHPPTVVPSDTTRAKFTWKRRD